MFSTSPCGHLTLKIFIKTLICLLDVKYIIFMILVFIHCMSDRVVLSMRSMTGTRQMVCALSEINSAQCHRLPHLQSGLAYGPGGVRTDREDDGPCTALLVACIL